MVCDTKPTKKEFCGYWFIAVAATIPTRMQVKRRKKSALNKKISVGRELVHVFITKGLDC